MAKLAENLSLFELIGKTKNKYELSFITTLNAYLPFYEQIVLPQLKNAGCRINTLLMDERQLSTCFSSDHSLPKLSGIDYTLLPIKAGGVFHPKIIMLVGCDAGLICVGSHNVTFSGFGKNRELTSCFEWSRDENEGDLQLFQKVWQSLMFWAKDQPSEIKITFDRAEQISSWLNDPLDSEAANSESQTHFISSAKNGVSLWEQLRSVLPNSIDRISLIAPFFDDNLLFLQRIVDDCKPKQLVIGIEPNTVYIPRNLAASFKQAKFVNADTLAGRSGYLHAKCISFESENDGRFICIGSANASNAAWLEKGSRKNAEAVVLFKEAEQKFLLKDLGFDELINLPVIENWSDVREKSKTSIYENEFLNENKTFLHAIETEVGFEIFFKNVTNDDAYSNKGSKISETVLFDAQGNQIFKYPEKDLEIINEKKLIIKIESSEIRTRASRLEFNINDQKSFSALVYHPRKIANHFHRGKYSDIFTSLESFEQSISEQLLKIIDKIIFDETDTYADNLKAAVNDSTFSISLFEVVSANETNQENMQETFQVSSDEIERRRHLNILSRDNLSELLTFVNRRLYSTNALDDQATNFISEEEQIDSDNEPHKQDHKTSEHLNNLARICRAKTNTMMRRMINRLADLSHEEQSRKKEQFILIRQLLVVLSFIKLVRDFESQQKSLNNKIVEDFIDHNKEWKFFVEASAYFFSSMEETLTDQAFNSVKEDYNSVIVYLLWLAWDCKFDVEKLDQLKLSRYNQFDNQDGWEAVHIVEGIACLLKLSNKFVFEQESDRQTENIFNINSENLVSDKKALNWLIKHQNWIRKVKNAQNNSENSTIQKPDIGDFIYLKKSSKFEIYIVEESTSTNVKILDFNSENWQRTVSSKNEYIGIIDI